MIREAWSELEEKFDMNPILYWILKKIGMII